MMKYLRSIYIWLFVALTAVVTWSCDDKHGDEPESPQTRTVLVYMVADNNLSGWAAQDLQEMREAVRNGLPSGGRWLVYYSGPDHRPRLIEFDKEGNQVELAGYDSSDLSVSIGRMREVIADAKRLAPASGYGLVLWSHGTGWLNETGSVEEAAQAPAVGSRDDQMLNPQSFGYDGYTGARMKVTSLARALEGHHFDFIYFDCCHMANIEVIYELRHAADRIVACPTELGVEGMPYNTNVSLLLNNRVREAAAATFRYYDDDYRNDDGYGCAIGVYSTAAVSDVAAALRDITAASLALPADYYRVPYFRPSVMRSGIYDLNDYVAALNPSASLKKAYDAAAGRLVEYFATTPEVYMLDASSFSGVAGNIVESPYDVNTYGYDELSWYDLVWKDGYEN